MYGTRAKIVYALDACVRDYRITHFVCGPCAFIYLGPLSLVDCVNSHHWPSGACAAAYVYDMVCGRRVQRADFGACFIGELIASLASL